MSLKNLEFKATSEVIVTIQKECSTKEQNTWRLPYLAPGISFVKNKQQGEFDCLTYPVSFILLTYSQKQ